MHTCLDTDIKRLREGQRLMMEWNGHDMSMYHQWQEGLENRPDDLKRLFMWQVLLHVTHLPTTSLMIFMTDIYGYLKRVCFMYGIHDPIDFETEGNKDLADFFKYVLKMTTLVRQKNVRKIFEKGTFEKLDTHSETLVFEGNYNKDKILLATNASPNPVDVTVMVDGKQIQLHLEAWEYQLFDATGMVLHDVKSYEAFYQRRKEVEALLKEYNAPGNEPSLKSAIDILLGKEKIDTAPTIAEDFAALCKNILAAPKLEQWEFGIEFFQFILDHPLRQGDHLYLGTQHLGTFFSNLKAQAPAEWKDAIKDSSLPVRSYVTLLFRLHEEETMRLLGADEFQRLSFEDKKIKLLSILRRNNFDLGTTNDEGVYEAVPKSVKKEFFGDDADEDVSGAATNALRSGALKMIGKQLDEKTIENAVAQETQWRTQAVGATTQTINVKTAEDTFKDIAVKFVHDPELSRRIEAWGFKENPDDASSPLVIVSRAPPENFNQEELQSLVQHKYFEFDLLSRNLSYREAHMAAVCKQILLLDDGQLLREHVRQIAKLSPNSLFARVREYERGRKEQRTIITKCITQGILPHDALAQTIAYETHFIQAVKDRLIDRKSVV
jgi:hypothetical protein